MITPRASAALFVLFALFTLTPGQAGAQCEFNAVANAKGLKASLTRGFAGCPSTSQHERENSNTQAGIAACAPVLPLEDGFGQTGYQFADTASCSIGITARIAGDCSALSASVASQACFAMSVKGKCKGILRNDADTPIDAADGIWSLALLVRTSTNDPLSGDVTLIDLPIIFESEAPKGGSLKFKGNSVEALNDQYGALLAALPTCTQMEIVRVTLRDGSNRPFARLGVGSAAAAEAGPEGS